MEICVLTSELLRPNATFYDTLPRKTQSQYVILELFPSKTRQSKTTIKSDLKTIDSINNRQVLLITKLAEILPILGNQLNESINQCDLRDDPFGHRVHVQEASGTEDIFYQQSPQGTMFKWSTSVPLILFSMTT